LTLAASLREKATSYTLPNNETKSLPHIEFTQIPDSPVEKSDSNPSSLRKTNGSEKDSGKAPETIIPSSSSPLTSASPSSGTTGAINPANDAHPLCPKSTTSSLSTKALQGIDLAVSGVFDIIGGMVGHGQDNCRNDSSPPGRGRKGVQMGSTKGIKTLIYIMLMMLIAGSVIGYGFWWVLDMEGRINRAINAARAEWNGGGSSLHSGYASDKYVLEILKTILVLFKYMCFIFTFEVVSNVNTE